MKPYEVQSGWWRRSFAAMAASACLVLTGCGGGGGAPSPVTYSGAQISTVACNATATCMTAVSGLLVGATRYDIRLTAAFTTEFPDPSKVGIQWGNPTLTAEVLDALRVALDANGITGFSAPGVGFSTGVEAPYASPKEAGWWRTILLSYFGVLATPPVPGTVTAFDTTRDPYTGLVAVIAVAK